MTVELLQTLCTLAYILAGLFFMIAIILYFVLKVPKIYSDLTGRTEKMAIAAIRQQNGEVVVEGTGTTDQISSSGKLMQKDPAKGKNQGARRVNAIETQVRGNRVAITASLGDRAGDQNANVTTVLDATNETTVLSSATYVDETVVLATQPVVAETTVLNQNLETTVLNQEVEPVDSAPIMPPAFTETTQAPAYQTGWNTPQIVVEVDLFFAESKELIQ